MLCSGAPPRGARRACCCALYAGLHEAAIRLVEVVYTGTMRSRAIERTFVSLAARCVQLQHRQGRQALADQPAGSASGGASFAAADPVTQAAAAAAWNELRVLFDRCVPWRWAAPWRCAVWRLLTGRGHGRISTLHPRVRSFLRQVLAVRPLPLPARGHH